MTCSSKAGAVQGNKFDIPNFVLLTLLSSSALATEVIMEVAGRKIVINDRDRFPCDYPCMRRKLDVKYGGRYTIDSWKCDRDGIRPPGGGGEDHDLFVTFFIAEYENPPFLMSFYPQPLQYKS